MMVTDDVYLNNISPHIADGIQVKMLLRQFLEIWSVEPKARYGTELSRL